MSPTKKSATKTVAKKAPAKKKAVASKTVVRSTKSAKRAPAKKKAAGKAARAGAGGPKHQFAMVLDLNKCLGCQTCSIACKTQWTRGPGMEPMWWNIVSTIPGRGTPA